MLSPLKTMTRGYSYVTKDEKNSQECQTSCTSRRDDDTCREMERFSQRSPLFKHTIEGEV